MPNLITDADRQYILNQLSNASDEVLVRAYQDWDAQRIAAVEVRGKIGQTNYKAPEPPKAPLPSERENVAPGSSTITKIGAIAKEEILQILRRGDQPPAKYLEHCKLLWERGEIRFDGKEFWV